MPTIQAQAPDGLLDGLNDEQRTAVTHGDGPLLVLAGAGTGKTTTICARLAWLVGEGVPAESIVLLTFTRRAAREMVGRARGLLRLGEGGARFVGGTFHSVAYRYVREHARSLGLPPVPAVLDAGDVADLIDVVREELGLARGDRRFPRKATLADIVSRAVNAQQPLSEVVARDFPWCERHVPALAELFREVTARKRRLGLVDYDDLLLYLHALARDPVVGAEIGEGISHLLVDEYQDLNALQVEIVRTLRAGRRELTVVGDDAQAIYGFRAASAEHILAFAEHFPDARIVTLHRNYRSTQPILEAANALALQFERAYPKQLVSVRGGGDRPALVHCQDDRHEARQVAERILALYEEGLPLRSQAVLSRASHHTEPVELELTRRDVPYHKYGGLRYLDAAHVKDFLALLRLAEDAGDELAWFRVLQLLEGVGPATARRVVDALERDGVRSLERWEAASAHLPPAARGLADGLIEALCRDERPGTAQARAERLRSAFAPVLAAHYVDADGRVADLDALVGAAAGVADLRTLAAELALDPPASTADWAGKPHLDEDYVVVSTVHSAKGLEWDAVHVVHASDGNIPVCMALSTPAGLEEERRLLYVALTRARRQLAVYVPARYYHRPAGADDAHGYGKPSRFLSPAVRAACDEQRPDDGAAGPHARSAATPIAVSLDHLWQ